MDVLNKENIMRITWGSRVSQSFLQALKGMGERLNWDEDHLNWLMACMAFETGLTFSPRKQNKISMATGLIQFMPGTARGLKTSIHELLIMTPEQQLKYVELYFKPNAHRISNIESMYMAILWPAAIPKNLEYVLWRTGTRAYFQNRGLDINKDGSVTKREAVSKVKGLFFEGSLEKNVGII